MAQQKITIALVGNPKGLQILENQILSYVKYCSGYSGAQLDRNKETDANSVIENFSFEGYQITIFKVTEFSENLPKFDGVLWGDLKQGYPPPIKEEGKQKDSESNLSFKESVLENIQETLETDNSEFTKRSFQVTDMHEDPYFCLAEKLGCRCDAIPIPLQDANNGDCRI